MTACIDSDVLIDYFDGLPSAGIEVSRYDRLLISRITWIEVLVGAPTSDVRGARQRFFGRVTLVELDERIAIEAIALRQRYRLKLADAIIWATARTAGALLVTRNRKDFSADDPGIRIPYQV